jgi:hypothetical protein
VRQAAPCQASRVVKPGVFAEAAKGRGERRRGHGAQAIRTLAFCRSVAQFTGHGRRRAYLSLKSESLKGSRKMSDQERWLNEGLTASWHDRDRGYSLRRPARRRPPSGAHWQRRYRCWCVPHAGFQSIARASLAIGIVRGRYDGGLSEIYESL